MNRKVLVVEDDPAVRKAVSFILEGNRHLVMTAANVRDAMLLAPEADVILLDLKLGSESGDQFLQEFRSQGFYTPVIVLSGVFPRSDAEARLKKYKIVDFIEKPFKAKDLLEKVESAEKVAGTMESTCEAADRFVAATENLRLLAGKSITEIGHRMVQG